MTTSTKVETQPSVATAGERTAVLVVHGMGQQRKFETLSDVADQIEKVAGGVRTKSASNVRIEDERVTRMELELVDGRKVDVYEAYWAPITEGAVTLRDVMAFLWGAAWNGVRNVRSFKRWIFGRYEAPAGENTPGVTTLAYLVIASAVLASLVFINALTVLFGTASVAEVGPAWASDLVVVPDLTASILMFLAAIIGFAALYVCAKKQKTGNLTSELALSRWGFRYFIGLCGITVAVVLTMLLTIANAHYAPRMTVAPVQFVRDLGYLLPIVAAWSGALATFGTVAMLAIAASFCAFGSIQRRRFGFGAAVLLLGFAAGVVLLGAARATVPGSIFIKASMPGLHPNAVASMNFVAAQWLAVWGALAFVSYHVRRFLVQYVGDVAAYVSPSSLDRFDAIRDRIKECTSKTASAIYRARENGEFLYRDVIVVGHSLGSVAAYDCLNRMLNDDAHAQSELQVRARTKGLLTFGSPLDKTAFLFEVTSSGGQTRAALAATVQPLIADPATLSIPWTNIYSNWDIISGDLDFYGTNANGKNRVENLVDYDAVTPLGAHTEYWANTKVWESLNSMMKQQTLGPKMSIKAPDAGASDQQQPPQPRPATRRDGRLSKDA